MILQKLGGDYQLVIDRPQDMAYIGELAVSHWMITSAPRDSYICDAAFLKYLDRDDDGRIMSDDVKAAQQWLFRITNTYGDMGSDNPVLKLSAIDVTHKDGQALFKAAKRILSNLGHKDTNEITLAQVRNRKTIVAQGGRNGDGVIPPQAVEDIELRVFVEDLISSADGVLDANGNIGVDKEILDRFLDESRDYLNWVDKKTIPNGQNSTELMVLGQETDEAYALVKNIASKIDDFFHYSWFEKHHNYARKSMAVQSKDGGQFGSSPISMSFHDDALVFDNRINPIHRNSAFKFRDTVLRGFVAKKDICSMSLDDWEKIKEKFKPFDHWMIGKPKTKAELIDVQKLQRYLEGDYADKLRQFIQTDLEVANDLK